MRERNSWGGSAVLHYYSLGRTQDGGYMSRGGEHRRRGDEDTVSGALPEKLRISFVASFKEKKNLRRGIRWKKEGRS